MKRSWIVCLVSLALGILLAELWHSGVGRIPAQAQEPRGGLRPAPTGPVPAAPSVSRTSALPPITQAPAEETYTPEELVNIRVYETVNRSVVNISTAAVRSSGFLIFDIEVPTEGAGSGSVIDNRGHILTNYHVVDGAREIKVTLFDAKEYDGRLVGRDESNDVAVIKIDAPPDSLYPVTFGDSTHLRVGQRVFAIGNPFGLERTLTTGVISSLNRSLPTRNHRTIKSIIQIDAAINPGSSGGPLLDSHARLIGMNTAIATATGQSAGVGFAIPVANIARIVPQLVERGKVIRPDVGIARVMETERGLLIATLTPNGPAEKAGLRGFRVVRQQKKQGPFSVQSQSIDRNAADLIVAVNGERVQNVDDFLSLVESQQPGQEVVLTVIREGHEMRVPVRLAAGES